METTCATCNRKVTLTKVIENATHAIYQCPLCGGQIEVKK